MQVGSSGSFCELWGLRQGNGYACACPKSSSASRLYPDQISSAYYVAKDGSNMVQVD